MPICRTIIAIGCLGSVCVLAGCGTVSFTSDGSPGSEDFLSAGLDGFGGNRPLVVEADKTTSQATTVSLPGDLLEDAADDAVMVLSAADITITVNDESSGRKKPTAKAAEHHARVTFHFAPPGKDACNSDNEVGPFELTFEDGVVTLVQESLPLDTGARSTMRNGRFEVCTKTWANFDGSISIDNITFEFGRRPHNEDRVVICHIPPGNPDNAHTITVGTSGVDAHLAHGDYLGECQERADDDDDSDDGDDDSDGDDSDGDDSDDSDNDSDGVPDEDDKCPGTASGSEVDADGCSCEELENCDSDGDGVTDDHDGCAGTPAGDDVDEAGCSCSQRDGDADGVNDCDDACLDSPDGDEVDEAGCSVTGVCEGTTRMVTATITADNHYALFVGSEDGASLSAIGGNELGHGGSPGRYNWSLPETYTFSTDESFIFVAAWSHDGVAQGLLAEFATDGLILLSGDPLWMVFATGIDKDDNDPYPTETEMATQIGLANAGGAWVAATVTDYYNGVAPWGRIEAISVEALWMWHLATGANAFEPGNNHDEYLIFRAPIPCSPTDSNDPQGCSAQSVVSFTQGKRRNGDAVLSERSNPENALGEAQRDDTVNFVSLGFGGELILDIGKAVLNETGDDVQIIETTYANRDGSWEGYPEQAEVYASQNGTDWLLLGIDRQDGTFDLGELDWARYFRLVDITDPSRFSANVNGFDVDAIESLSNCESLPDEEGDEDGDGVFDEDDECPDTAPGSEVDVDGCTVVTLSAFAGPDVDAIPGDIVEAVGQGAVLTGDYPEEDLVYNWRHVGGDPVQFDSTGPPLTIDTTDATGDITFLLTVSTADGSVEASDEFTINMDMDAVGCESTIVAIAPSAGKDSTNAQSINDNAQVTGFSYNRDHIQVRFSDEDRMGFLYDSGELTTLGGLGYGLVAFGGQSYGVDINESGVVAVTSRVSRWQHHAAYWENGQLHDIHGFGYGQSSGCNSRNLAVDNNGRMGGWAEFTSAGPWRLGGALYVDGVPEEINVEGYNNAVITDLADNGDVLLYASHCGPYGVSQCPETFILRDDVFIPINPIDGFTYTRPYEITENGMVVGTLEGPGLDTQGFIYDGTVVTQLTPLDGAGSEARATGINEEGLIVGYTADSEVNTATIWIDGEAVDLNDYLPAGSGWVLTEAREINNHNVVVGSGELNGEIRAFVLSLCDAP